MNRYFEVSYKLFDVSTSETELIEEATSEHPFTFISEMGLALEAFEQRVAPLKKGERFDFTLSPEEAYGIFEDDHVVELSKDIFTINGHFDHDNIFPDAVVPLQNADGHQFLGKVIEIGEQNVKMDLNHPLAGKTLRFEGVVIDEREATNKEIQNVLNHMGGCGCGCGHCEDEHCGDEHSHCGCGHCH